MHDIFWTIQNISCITESCMCALPHLRRMEGRELLPLQYTGFKHAQQSSLLNLQPWLSGRSTIPMDSILPSSASTRRRRRKKRLPGSRYRLRSAIFARSCDFDSSIPISPCGLEALALLASAPTRSVVVLQPRQAYWNRGWVGWAGAQPSITVPMRRRKTCSRHW
jgi:hypothetical protein